MEQTAPDVSPPVYRNMRDAFKQVYRTSGLRGFFVGFTPCLLRAFPANAAAFTGMYHQRFSNSSEAAFEIIMHALPA